MLLGLFDAADLQNAAGRYDPRHALLHVRDMFPSRANVPDVPDQFYKYRPMNDPNAVERVRQIVVDHTLFFASARSFNDPFDLNPAFSLRGTKTEQREDFRNLSEKYSPELTAEEREAEVNRVMATSLSPDTVDLTAQQIQFFYRQHILKEIGTFCVSAQKANLLMWAHYGDSHRGVCLAFDASLSEMNEAQPVVYAPERVPINRYAQARGDMMVNALLTKSDHWAYEEEWRALRPGSPGKVTINSGCLTGIIFGALASPETIAAIREMVQQRAVPLALYRAVVSNHFYALDVIPVK